METTRNPILLHPEEKEVISKLLRRLGRRSTVRPIAERILDGEPPSEVDAAILVGAACDHHRRFREREAAMWALGWTPSGGRLREDAVEVLCGILRIKRIAIVAWGCLGCMVYPVYFVLWPLFVWAIRENNRRNQLISQAAQSLGRLGSLASLAPLAAVAREGNAGIRWTAVQSLLQIMPQIRDSDAELCESALPDIYRLLPFLWSPHELGVALDALRKVGNGHGLGRNAEGEDRQNAR